MLKPYQAHGVLSCDYPGCQNCLVVGVSITPQPLPMRGANLEVVYLPENDLPFPEEKKFKVSSLDPAKVYCPKCQAKTGTS